jgi:hypothetical protein
MLMLAVTIVPSGFERSRGKLHTFEVRKFKDAMRKRIERCGVGAEKIIGVVEVSLCIDSKSPAVWVPHLHMAIATKQDDRVRKALKKGFPKGHGVYKPVMVKPIHDLTGWLSYMVKPYTEARVGFKGEDGRARTKDRALDRDAQLEALVFSHRVTPESRIFLRNVRRAGSRFVI